MSEFKVLDKGLVKYIDHMGSDDSIAEAARGSHDGKVKRDNSGLIKYLIRHGHWSPFEFAEIIFHIKAPIFVARHIFRHRTANFNEKSGRYTDTYNDFYAPPQERMNPDKGKQGSDGENEIEHSQELSRQLGIDMNGVFSEYHNVRDIGLTKEVARVTLPLATYTEFYFKMDLRNLFHFLNLRLDRHAQYETFQYAQIINHFVSKLFPVSHQAWLEYEKRSIKFSHSECKILGYLLFLLDYGYNELYDHMKTEMEMRESEIKEFMEKLGKLHPKQLRTKGEPKYVITGF